ncbi:MAG: XdhC family protein [Pseudomonadales bacterium]
MLSLDEKVIMQINEWLQQGLQQRQAIWLCTVIHTWGSAPRLPGSLMVCNQEGVTVGSLSGGCIEENLVERLCDGQLAQHSAEYKLYGQTKEEIERFQLPCGGTLGILIEPLLPAQLSVFSAIETALQQRTIISRNCHWPADNMTTATVLNYSSLEFERDQQGAPVRLRQVYGPVCHLIIIGVSEVSRFLAEFALAAGYRVTVCDPRPELAAQWKVDNAVCLTAMPDDVIREQADSQTAIVALTHDPRIDDMGLMDAFGTDAFYIGAMGSGKTSAKRRERLQLLGVDADQLQRLHAPIGLEINSKTPVEIAIAIVAELIALRAQPAFSS